MSVARRLGLVLLILNEIRGVAVALPLFLALLHRHLH